jgi:N-acetylglucosamine kinase-like BadF-type ATPase
VTVIDGDHTGTTIAIDAGQTGTKVRVLRGAGSTLEAVHPGVRTHEPLLPQLVDVIRAQQRDLHESVTGIALGVSGLTRGDADAETLLRRLTDIGMRRVLLAHDSVTSFLGSLGDTHGAVVAAGTGVVTLGVGTYNIARVDGWGNIMGDAGSAYWIGREALEAAMRAHDGRDTRTALTEAVRERWSNIEDAYVHLQSDPERVRIVASFAEAVTALADSDTVSAQISLRAARELARSVVTALGRVEDPADPDADEAVGAIGGVFSSPIIRARFEELVSEARPHARIIRPRGTGLDGASALFDLPSQHPLTELISVATLDH